LPLSSKGWFKLLISEISDDSSLIPLIKVREPDLSFIKKLFLQPFYDKFMGIRKE